jgi:hypothetical protein
MIAQVDAVQLLGQQRRGQSPCPFVEITEHELWTADMSVQHDTCEPPRLVPPLENRGAKMDVVHVQQAAIDRDIDALETPRLAGFP